MMEDLFPEDVAARILGDGGNNKHNNLYVTMVRAPGGGIGGLWRAIHNKMILHHQFTDGQDLINAMKAKMNLPYILDGNAAQRIEGRASLTPASPDRCSCSGAIARAPLRRQGVPFGHLWAV